MDPEQWLTTEGSDITYPFVEDENCNITGYGHQDRAQFASFINDWDRIECGVEDGEIEASDIAHDYARVDPDNDEFLWRCAADMPGAFPITTLWGYR